MGADKGIYLFTQLTGVSTKEYFEQFKALVDTDESYVSSPGHSKALVDAQKREAVEFKPHKKRFALFGHVRAEKQGNRVCSSQGANCVQEL